MAGTTRIEELQKKFDENPRRYFAPLANEYRKAGDIDQAIAICQEYLPQQPGHMSGHIVYGQALFEASRFDDARTVFETALTLDPENLIALRHLGDIAREAGDLAAARGWYQRVLEADPRNEEIGALIEMLDQNPAVSSTAPTPISTPTVQAEAVAPAAIEAARTLSDVPTVEIPRMGGAPAAEPVADFPLETTATEPPMADLDLAVGAATEPAPREASQPSAGEPLDIPLELPEDIFGGAQAGTPPAAVESTPAELGLSFAIESATGSAAPAGGDEESGSADSGGVAGLVPTSFEDPGALEGLEPTSFDDQASAETAAGADTLGVTAAFEVEGPATPAPVAREEGEQEPASSVELPFITDGEGEEPAAEEPVGRGAPSFVTETMAELYLRQGHRDEAVAVYRQLIAQRPDDAGLRARLDEVQRGAHGAARGPSIRDFLGAFANRRPAGWDDDGADEYVAETGNGATAATAESAAAGLASGPVGGGQAPRGSIDALFPEGPAGDDEAAAERLARAFAGDEIDRRDDAAIAGAPARRATTELSLDHVFRERGATPAHGQPSFSFDQFFAHGAASHEEPAGGEQAGVASDAPDDDIQQFNAWLEGLKKS